MIWFSNGSLLLKWSEMATTPLAVPYISIYIQRMREESAVYETIQCLHLGHLVSFTVCISLGHLFNTNPLHYRWNRSGHFVRATTTDMHCPEHNN